ncbi:DUF2339 domain-containing protein [Leptospira koniambonensis]|uniref:DUF2339 domain-containing protein n=1 Tax=Leptospira koniambonensis TaxID=2484950 RepID=A0A4R9J8U9_9LEPT|nr:DUF2339 domain-containing protein [Leptospira koniambonensis]TGL34284.1 DUF2339 domain-containing protein [Leptospira koniambonensis]
MEFLIGLLAFFAGAFYLIIPFVLLSKINGLLERIQDLENRLKDKGPSTLPETQVEKKKQPIKEEKPILVKETIPEAKKEVSTSKQVTKDPKPSAVVTPTIIKQEPQPIAKKSEAWEKFEKQIANNWTGILGTIILVMGVGFLGIYAALNMSPFFRFLMVLGIGIGLFVISLLLVKREFWKQIGYWIRSGSGAVILFSCIAAVSVPGMKWIESEYYALILIIAGISINLGLAWQTSQQKFASLHIVLSLISLAILPLSTLIFFLAVGVSAFSVVLSYRTKWEFHLIQTAISFLILNFLYKGHFSEQLHVLNSPLSRTWGILGTLVVGIPSILAHYRKVYSSPNLQRLPFITHLIIWAGIGLGLSVYSTGSKWNPPVLIFVSIGLFFWARTAREKLNIRWLYLTDTLVSLALASIGIILLTRWEVDLFLINVYVSLLFSIFFVVSAEEKENLLKNIGAVLLHISWVWYILLLIIKYSGGVNLGTWPIVITTIVMIILTFLIQFYDEIRNKEVSTASDDVYGIGGEDRISPAGVFSGLLASAICFQLFDWKHSELYLPAFGVILLAIRQNRNWNGLGVGIFFFVAALHFEVIYRIYSLERCEVLLRDFPTILFCFLMIPLSKVKMGPGKIRYFSSPGAILLSLHIVFLAYWTTQSVSPFLPGILWLLLSLVYLETKNFFSEREKVWENTWKSSINSAGPVWQFFALIFVGLFLGAHVLVHLQSELYVGIFKIRFLIQALAIGVFLYWANSPNPKKETPNYWNSLLPLFWELTAIFITAIIALEIPNTWLPVAWIVWAFFLNQVSLKTSWEISRFRFYSLCFYWYSCIHVAFISSSALTPSEYWANQEWLGGLIGIVLQISYLVRIQLLPPFQGIEAEGYPGKIRNLSEKLDQRSDYIIFYPLFAAGAFFLFWSFDSSLLTLLWMVEVFIVFLMGLILKKEHFRYVSLVAMIVCLLRLIFWDLSQSSTITRALVFLGVGGILILMNTLYGKFGNKEKTDAP